MKLQNEVSQVDEGSSQDGLQAPPKKKGTFSSIFCTGTVSSSTSSTNAGTTSESDQFKRELEMYLQYPILDIDISPLQWWKMECKDCSYFPQLLVNTFVCVPQVLHLKECLVLVAK